jgi:hypothetical protein
MRFHPEPNRFRLSKSPPLSRETKASSTNSTLGGGALIDADAIRAILKVGGLPEVAATGVKVRSNRPYVAGFLWTDSAAEGELN